MGFNWAFQLFPANKRLLLRERLRRSRRTDEFGWLCIPGTRMAGRMDIPSCQPSERERDGFYSSPGDTANATRPSLAAHGWFFYFYFFFLHICNCSLFPLSVVINVVRFLKNCICLDVNRVNCRHSAAGAAI